jgi:glycosyltransferase involved in cell wall biosynthesis
MKVAIITPYHKESREAIERCIASVQQQTINSDHFLISDGHPQAFLDNIGVRHIKLDVSYGDNGNTPRGIGAQLAISEGYNGVAFLDADHWYESDHVQVCIEAAKSLTGNYIDCDYVVARRRLLSSDFKFKAVIPKGDEDTNLFYFCPGSYFMVPYWNLMPKEVSGICEVIFNAHLSLKNLVFAQTEKVTVNYVTRWANHYKQWGLPVPKDAKVSDFEKSIAWCRLVRSPREEEILRRLIGVQFDRDVQIARVRQAAAPKP